MNKFIVALLFAMTSVAVAADTPLPPKRPASLNSLPAWKPATLNSHKPYGVAAGVSANGVVVTAPPGSDVQVDVDGNDVQIDVTKTGKKGLLGLGFFGL